jgi:hypothetical protein
LVTFILPIKSIDLIKIISSKEGWSVKMVEGERNKGSLRRFIKKDIRRSKQGFIGD